MSCSSVSRIASLQAPNANELEVLVCGPRYGESICVHIGDNRWLVVDSCLYGKSRTPAPLHYLSEIGVDPNSIEFIAATHWHDDHVGGLFEVANASPLAKIFLPDALRTGEFMSLAVAHGETRLSGGVREFHRILNDLPPSRFEFCTGSKLLVRTTTSAGAVEVHALSPSSEEFRQSLISLRNLVAKEGQPIGRSPAQSPNDVAMVLQIRVGTTQFVLGADLEEHGSPLRGWQAVLRQVAATSGSTLFKVPHHGSVTAYHQPVWTNWLGQSPVAVVTPFHHGRSKLPSPSEVAAIKAHTNSAFISTEQPLVRAERKGRIVETEIELKTSGRGLMREPIEPGMVRCRIVPSVTGNWTVGLFGGASTL